VNRHDVRASAVRSVDATAGARAASKDMFRRLSRIETPISFNHSQTEIPMNKVAITTFVLAAALGASTAFAQQKMDEMKSMDMSKTPAASAPAAMSHQATGIVKKVDAKAGLVTLAHEPVKTMNWPAMTMGFQVKDKMLFDDLAVGKKVDFEFVQGSKGSVVTAVK
jgi:Cu(I)/Ag(I) efflux system protein CusF